MKSNYFATASSSLDLAMEMATSGQLRIWDSVLVGQQSAGRGQMRRHWFSPAGNIHAALRLPLLPPLDTTAAAPAMAALLAEGLEAVLPVFMSGMLQAEQKGQQTAGQNTQAGQAPVMPVDPAGRDAASSPLLPWIQVKWPNDIVVRKGGPAKLAGILLEQKGDVLLAGIGLNLVAAPPDQILRQDHAMPATCLADVIASGDGGGQGRQMPEPRDLWPELARQVRDLFTPDFCATWQARLESRLLWLGRQVMVSDGQSRASGRLVGVDPAGGLRLAPDGAHQGSGEQVLFCGSLALLA